ncbi:RNase H domain-containing protein [Trichonephila clavipes]|nr:RNase H domain-containing protein [Trichonephila clavipes]
MITGGVKTTPVLAMQLLCDLQPFTNIIEKNAAILFNRLIRLPNNSFWRDYDSDGGRNLKTQKGFIQCVRENIRYKVINDVPFELLSFANPLDYAILDIRLDLVLNVRKRDLSPTALHAIALETINTRFPPEEWLHIYTDGSLLDFAQGASIDVFSHLFSFYLHAGPLTTHFDDSTSALQALSNYNENNCLRVQNCRELLGNHFALQLLVLLVISLGTISYSTLCKKSHGIPSSPRAAAVAKFRLLTGYDCLCAHLFRFNLVTSPICVLCDTGQDMTAAHLDECSALNDLNCIHLDSNPGEGRVVCKCIVPAQYEGTINSLRNASSLVRLVEWEERWEAHDHLQAAFPQNWGGIEPNRTITCMVLKATDNDRCTNSPLRDEFRGPRSDAVEIRWHRKQQQNLIMSV